MDTVYQIVQLILCLSILVTLHEFGHYFTAKWFKMRIEKFFLFFDWPTKLFSKKIGETEWGIGMIPLGGYVKISGMIDESMDKEQMKQPAQPWEFRSKPAWQRLIVMLGGVTVNFFLAWFIYACVFSTYGDNYISTQKIQQHGLEFGDTGREIGFKNGDRILKVDRKEQPRFNRLFIDVLLGDTVTILRDGKEINIHLTDEHKKEILSKEGKGFLSFRKTDIIVDSLSKKSANLKSGLAHGDKIVGADDVKFAYYDQLKDYLKTKKKDSIKLQVIRNNNAITIPVVVSDTATLGFKADDTYFDKQSAEFNVSDKYSFFCAFPQALDETITNLVYQVKQFKLIIKPKTEAYKQVKGPIGIIKAFDPSWDWELFWKFTAMFSVWLAFVNLLPIPGLDGGHALFTIVEMITGKTLNDKAMGIVQTIGMVILLSLMILIFGKDIYELIYDKFFK